MSLKAYDKNAIGEGSAPTGRPLYLTVFNSTSAKNVHRKYKNGTILQVASVPPRYCMRDAIKISNTEISKFRLRCRSNYCPYCFKKNMEVLQHRLFKLICINELNHFLTLTLDPKTIPEGYVNKTHSLITRLFHTFITGVRYHSPSLKYVWVIEFQQIGNAHIHLLTNKYLPVKYLRDRWTNLGGGNMMKVEYIKDSVAISHYLSKYLTKDTDGINKFYYMEKRYGVSYNCEGR